MNAPTFRRTPSMHGSIDPDASRQKTTSTTPFVLGFMGLLHEQGHFGLHGDGLRQLFDDLAESRLIGGVLGQRILRRLAAIHRNRIPLGLVHLGQRVVALELLGVAVDVRRKMCRTILAVIRLRMTSSMVALAVRAAAP